MGLGRLAAALRRLALLARGLEPNARAIRVRVSVNALSAREAARAAFDPLPMSRSERSGEIRVRPAPKSLCLALAQSPRLSWIGLLEALERSAPARGGPVTGYWVEMNWLDRLEGSAVASRLLISLTAEPCALPHREPMAYAGEESDPRGPLALRQETDAFWEALGLIEATGLPERRANPARRL